MKVNSCPFCGSEKVRIFSFEVYDVAFVKCEKCSARGPEIKVSEAGERYPIAENQSPIEAAEEQAIDGWNSARGVQIVSTDFIQKFIPCRCDEAYKGRDLSDPDCPFHTTFWEDMLEELGIKVEDKTNENKD